MHKILKIAAAALLLLAACNKDKENPEPEGGPTLSISPAVSAITFGVRVEESYTVTTDSPTWTAESDREWCRVALDDEAGTFTVTALPNDASAVPEPATITVKAGEAAPLTISVTHPEQSTISILPENMRLKTSTATSAVTGRTA